MIDVGRVHREGTLNTDTEGHLTDGEGLANAAILATDYDTFEDLHTGLVTFDNLHVNVKGIAGTEIRNIIAQLCCIDRVKNVHQKSLFLEERGTWRHFPKDARPVHIRVM